MVSDGRLYVASPMDPKLLLLPVLQQHGARFSPLEQILMAAANAPDAAPHAQHGLLALRRCATLDLGKVCDVNDQLGDDMVLYRLNEGKALRWLAQASRWTGTRGAETGTTRITTHPHSVSGCSRRSDFSPHFPPCDVL